MNRVVSILLYLITTFSYSQERIAEQINIPFTLSSDGHIIIDAKVNGVEGKFIFDTGAGLNLLTKKFADKVEGLEKTYHFTTGHRATGEEIKSDLWKSKTLEIGDFKINQELFTVYDIEFPLDGLISLTPFKNHQVTINFEDKVLSIESDESLKKIINDRDFEIPILISNDKEITIDIATYIQLENKLSLVVNLDSGAGFGVYRFNSRYMKDLGIDSTKLKREFRKSAFRPEVGNNFYFTTLSKLTDLNKNTTTEDLKVSFIDGLIYEGIMGIDWIGEKITIDIPNKKLIVKK